MKKLLFTCVMLVSVLYAEFDKRGTTTAQFLKIGVGARAQGMGGSFTALANDGSATFWNPAGLVQQRKIGVGLYHNPWVLDISHDYLSFSIPIRDRATCAFFFSALTMDDQEITTVNEPDGTGLYYSTMDLAAGFSYSRLFSDRLAYGFTFKYIRLSAYNEKASAVAFDMGSILKTDWYGMTIGMSLSNFGGELQFDGRDLITKTDIDEDIAGNYTADASLITESWPIPMLIRIGVAMEIMGEGDKLMNSENGSLLAAVDAVHPNDGPEYLSAGLEYGFDDFLFLRTGYRWNHVHQDLTFGAGAVITVNSLGRTVIDYAVIPMGEFGNTSQISLEFQLK